MRFRYLLCFLLMALLSQAQNVLVFKNVKDSSDTYQLPLGKFPVHIKLKDNATLKLIIDDLNDSMLVTRLYEKGSRIDSLIKNIRAESSSFLAQQKAVRRIRDSVNMETENKIRAIRYSTPLNIPISRIKKVTVNNHNFPDKKKQIKWVNAAAVVFLGGTLITASTQNPYYIGGGLALTAAAFVVKSIISTRDLDLIVPRKAKHRKRWRIAGIKNLA